MCEERLEFGNDILWPGVEMCADRAQSGFVSVDEIQRSLARHGFDPAGSGRDGHFSDDLDETDLAGGGDVGAAAEFSAIAADIDDANDAPVFVPEEGEGAIRLFVELGVVRGDGRVSDDLLVHER